VWVFKYTASPEWMAPPFTFSMARACQVPCDSHRARTADPSTSTWLPFPENDFKKIVSPDWIPAISVLLDVVVTLVVDVDVVSVVLMCVVSVVLVSVVLTAVLVLEVVVVMLLVRTVVVLVPQESLQAPQLL
jgi:hypothetical protein